MEGHEWLFALDEEFTTKHGQRLPRAFRTHAGQAHDISSIVQMKEPVRHARIDAVDIRLAGEDLRGPP